jgi:hypothetical protein
MLGVKPLLDKSSVLETTIKEPRSRLILHIARHGFFLSSKSVDLDLSQNTLGFAQINNRGMIDNMINPSEKERIDNPLLCR